MSYLKSIGYLNVNSNKITIMNGSFMSALLQSQTLKWLNLAFNDITNLPVNVQNLTHLEKIWLSGNPFHCDCEMTWMIGWLNNFTIPSKEHVIVDYQDIKCHSGKMKGKPIYKLNKVDLGCFPSRMTTLQKVGIGLGAMLALIVIIVLVTIIAKNSREAKFFMYYYLKLDTVPKDDKDDNVDNMQYDAFFCYR